MEIIRLENFTKIIVPACDEDGEDCSAMFQVLNDGTQISILDADGNDAVMNLDNKELTAIRDALNEVLGNEGTFLSKQESQNLRDFNELADKIEEIKSSEHFDLVALGEAVAEVFGIDAPEIDGL